MFPLSQQPEVTASRLGRRTICVPVAQETKLPTWGWAVERSAFLSHRKQNYQLKATRYNSLRSCQPGNQSLGHCVSCRQARSANIQTSIRDAFGWTCFAPIWRSSKRASAWGIPYPLASTRAKFDKHQELPLEYCIQALMCVCVMCKEQRHAAFPLVVMCKGKDMRCLQWLCVFGGNVVDGKPNRDPPNGGHVPRVADSNRKSCDLQNICSTIAKHGRLHYSIVEVAMAPRIVLEPLSSSILVYDVGA